MATRIDSSKSLMAKTARVSQQRCSSCCLHVMRWVDGGISPKKLAAGRVCVIFWDHWSQFFLFGVGTDSLVSMLKFTRLESKFLTPWSHTPGHSVHLKPGRCWAYAPTGATNTRGEIFGSAKASLWAEATVKTELNLLPSQQHGFELHQECEWLWPKQTSSLEFIWKCRWEAQEGLWTLRARLLLCNVPRMHVGSPPRCIPSWWGALWKCFILGWGSKRFEDVVMASNQLPRAVVVWVRDVSWWPPRISSRHSQLNCFWPWTKGRRLLGRFQRRGQEGRGRLGGLLESRQCFAEKSTQPTWDEDGETDKAITKHPGIWWTCSSSYGCRLL